MNTFITACIWGLGVSCGAAIGLLLFFVLKGLLDRLFLGKEIRRTMEVNEQSLAALHRRNELTVETIHALDRIVDAIESRNSP